MLRVNRGISFECVVLKSSILEERVSFRDSLFHSISNLYLPSKISIDLTIGDEVAIEKWNGDEINDWVQDPGSRQR